MIKTKRVFSNGFYILESRAAANSNYIESINEAKQFMVYAKYYLKSYLVIYDYIITRHGWQMAVKINKNQKMPQIDRNAETWRIISERIRLMISTYVRYANYKRGRKGVLVQCNYERYFFETLAEMKSQLNKMRNQQVKLYQSKKKYRGLKCHYRIDKELAKGSIFLCSKDLRKEILRSKIDEESKLFGTLVNLVGLKIIKSTLLLHNFNNSTQNCENSS